MICRFDTQLNITYANQATAEFFGCDRDSLIGANVVELSGPGNGEMTLKTMRSINLDMPKITGLQKMPDSYLFKYIEWTTIGIFDGDELIEYQSVGRNVSEQFRLDRELQRKSASLEQAQSELRTVLDAVPAMIWYKDDENKILHLNQAAAESMNMTVEEVQGQNTYDLFGPSAKSYHEADLEVIRSGVPLRGHVEPYTPDDGIQGWAQTDKIPLTDGPDGPRILVVSTDISTLKNQEALLQSVNKNLNDFASMVSHDLQAPLRKIGLSVELMELELGEALSDDIKPYMADIVDGVQGMRDLIRSFLHFMRSSPDSIVLRSVNLNEILEKAVQSLKDEIDEAEAEISLPEGETFVRGDAALLNQVFQNLIGNAVKYRSPDTPLKIDIRVEGNKQFWSIFFNDNGIGVDPRFANQIFDVFGRAKPEGHIEGSGIGLALCRRILTLHGGTIDLAPKDGDGAQFQIDLYRAKGT